jgi:hypothetical protein
MSDMAHTIETGPSDMPGMYTFALNGEPSIRNAQPYGMLTPNPSLAPNHPGAHGGRYFTIQRVNGNGANGKNDGVGGGHQHTLEESDRVKKSSVQRFAMKDKKDRRTRAVCSSHAVAKTPHDLGYVTVFDSTISDVSGFLRDTGVIFIFISTMSLTFAALT